MMRTVFCSKILIFFSVLSPYSGRCDAWNFMVSKMPEIETNSVLPFDVEQGKFLKNVNTILLTIPDLTCSALADETPEAYVTELESTLFAIAGSAAHNSPRSLCEEGTDRLLLAAIYGFLGGELMRAQDIAYFGENKKVSGDFFLKRLRSVVAIFPLTAELAIEERYLRGYAQKIFSSVEFPELTKQKVLGVFKAEVETEKDDKRSTILKELIASINQLEKIPSLREAKGQE